MQDQDQMLKNVRKIAPKHCDNCGAKYMPNDFKVLKLTDNNALLHLSCPTCANTYVINAFANQNGFGSQRVPLVLDLEGATEIEKFANTSPVNKNNAMDLFNFLSKNGSFSPVIKKDKVKKNTEALDLDSSKRRGI